MVKFEAPEDDALMPTVEEMAEARKAARKQRAREMALSELGMGDKKIPAIKGPIPVVEEEFTITLDLYEGSDRIIIDGRTFMHGGTYTVGQRLYNTLREIQSRGWGHQREIEGKDSNAYRRQQNQILKPDKAAAA